MKRQLLLLFTSFTFSTGALSLPLWELEGTRNAIRLLGSVHLLRAEDYPLPGAMDRAYGDAEIVVMEADLGQQDMLAMQSMVQQLAVDPRGRTLSELVGSAAYRRAQADASRFNIDIDLLQPYEPWFAALQITQLRLMQLGFSAGFGVDMHYSQRAGADRKRIIGLETVSEQLEMLDSLPAAAQRAFLLETVAEAAEIESGIDDILRAWRAGDTRGMQREMLSSMQDQPELYKKIIVARNRNWARAIATYANDDDDYLVVVGALHLVGPDSVLKMLDQAGYPSRQLRR